MARADSMAAIDAALQGIPTTSATVQQNNASPVAPHPAPGVQAPTPVSNAGKLTADEKRFIDAQRQAQNDEERRAEKFEAKQKAEQDAFTRSANATVQAAQGIVRGTGVAIGSLPTPGSLILPLAILLVFFFLLLPVNGHTRLVWLWLVLTGNAEIQQGGSSSSTSSTATPSSSTITTPSTSSASSTPSTSSHNPVTVPTPTPPQSSNGNSSPYGTQLPTWGDLGQWWNNLGSYVEEII